MQALFSRQESYGSALSNNLFIVIKFLHPKIPEICYRRCVICKFDWRDIPPKILFENENVENLIFHKANN